MQELVKTEVGLYYSSLLSLTLTFDSLETTVNQRYKAVGRDKASIPTEGFFPAG
jgi:hypothetical protein